MFLLGALLFALGIGVSIALHEAGHMYTAKAFGMKVRRYFIGFGPSIFSFRRGETEYGLKAIPAGGFCDIAGMTALEELPAEEAPRAMWRQPAWKRVTVLSAGSLTHFVLGILIIYVMAVSTGLPNLDRPPTPAVVGQVSECISAAANGTCTPGDPAPAREAGLQPGDRVLAVAGTPVANFEELVAATQPRSGPTEFLVDRDDRRLAITVDVARVPASALGGQGSAPVGAIGVQAQVVDAPATLQYGPLDAVGQTFSFTGLMFSNTWEGLKRFPDRVPAVAKAIVGEERPEDSPISVVGASRLGGEAADRGIWVFFLFLLAALNFFVGVFNLLPLLPLDGGHIAVTLYEKLRDGLRRIRGRPAGGPVDYTRLLPVTYAVMVVFIGVAALTITADIVNPIRLPR